MKSSSFLLLILLVCGSALGAALPGFRVQSLGVTKGFASSIAVDSRGTIYYTTTSGDLFRFVDGVSSKVAHLPTEAIGDSGLLGMALRDDRTAVVHYVNIGQTADVVSDVDLETGDERVLHSFVGDVSFPGRAVPVEHHGGNPTVAANGDVFVAIGDYGGGAIAALPAWNGGKIWRISPDGTATQFARGFRNPFDLAWDAARQRIVMTDNGPVVDDELNIVREGDYDGWPYTVGNQPAIEGAVAPRYVFPKVVAPTGLVALSGHNAVLSRGYLIGAFVSKAIYWIPDVDANAIEPIALITAETGSVIDVTEAASGEIFFVTGSAIYKLIAPARGDCDGDGLVNANDIGALALELADAGAFSGSLGCDVNGDGVVNTDDEAALAIIMRGRARSVRAR
ncbi:MAG: putative dependent glucose 1-dehydrogenase [Acidobacteria bacterium]|nr:putative dependent glucose 1-dehydrogenase [Acidobacteriota bacterium]